MSSLNYEDYLHKIWHDPKHAATFTGSDISYNIVKQEGKIKIGRLKIKQWLQDQDSYSLSRSITYNHPFQFGYQLKWTEEIFKIRRGYFRQNLTLYLVSDLHNDPIEGSFYQSEVQKERKGGDVKWKIEKLLKDEKRNGTLQALLRWLGYPKKFDSWIPVADIQNE
ncbi:unnamed protein product [Mytilus coruscus]|uniref:Chromo domain-containing protein n=1 Tax=Mytilus coruscus TaxID=42192 RepID=A0A6J8A1F7_MYTCO|nr:unnamed protein product [Mytilus coruscus]